MKSKFIMLIPFVLLSCAAARIEPLTSMNDLNYEYNVETISLSNNTSIAYVEQGQGAQTLLFIHGLGSYLPAWNKNLQELSKNYRCIAIDLPGYGKSSKGNYKFSMTYYAQVIKEFAEKKKLDNLVLVGHSMGGQIALTAAWQYPELIQKLVLIAPAGFETFNKGQLDWLKNAMTPDAVRFTTVEQIRTNLAYNFYNMPEDAEFMFTDRVAMRGAIGFDGYCYAVSESVKGMVDQPIFQFLPEIKQPVLAIFGANDNLIPNRYLNPGRTQDVALKGIEKMTNGTLVMLDNTGHFAQFEKPDAVNAEIKAFLN